MSDSELSRTVITLCYESIVQNITSLTNDPNSNFKEGFVLNEHHSHIIKSWKIINGAIRSWGPSTYIKVIIVVKQIIYISHIVTHLPWQEKPKCTNLAKILIATLNIDVILEVRSLHLFILSLCCFVPFYLCLPNLLHTILSPKTIVLFSISVYLTFI
jgi:hypothetical protein